jgi:GTP-binding protein EngB required for normal cell division
VLSVSAFEALERLAREAGQERLATEVRALAGRVRAGLFYTACVGQFKRGKSTLLNALIGEQVLPAGVQPVTAVVTVVRHGPRLAARLQFEGGAWRDVPVSDLARYVSEEQNPQNRLGVSAVEVCAPTPLLATGMCLVDTPGLGSVFASNTAATHAFVPHIDAALVVLGADPPISADELGLVERIARQCEALVFVMNKADKLGEAERAEAARFTRRVLAERLGLAEVRLFELSALERLEGRGSGHAWDAFVGSLEELARDSGGELVRAAGERGLGIVARRLGLELEERRGALVRPLEESERRVEALRACGLEARRALEDLGVLFAAEQARISRAFASRLAAFLSAAQPAARREWETGLRALPARRGPALRRQAIELAQAVCQRWMERWRAEAQPVADALYAEAAGRFAELAHGFLRRLAEADESALVRAVLPEVGLRARSRLFYTSLMHLTGQSPVGYLLDVLRPREAQLRALAGRVGAYLETLVHTNACRLVSDLDDRVVESRRRTQAELREVLSEAAESAERALADARARRAQGASEVAAELERLAGLRARLDALGPGTGRAGDAS